MIIKVDLIRCEHASKGYLIHFVKAAKHDLIWPDFLDLESTFEVQVYVTINFATEPA